MLADSALEFLKPSLQENEFLQELDSFYKNFCEMSQEEKEFLNSIILRHKPKKLLELGVSAGGASVIILNAIKNIGDAKLYSIDYCEEWYKDPSKKSGWILENYSSIRQKWDLRTGGMALAFIDDIGEDIEFALVDTVHACPGEILDILMVLPFLSDDSVVVFHDTNLHTKKINGKPCCNTMDGFVNNLLISALLGKKILQGNFDRSKSGIYFPNIAAVQLTKESKEHVFELFNLLTLKWSYLPKEEEMQKLTFFFEKHYSSYFADYFREVYEFQKAAFSCNPTFKQKIKSMIKKVLRGGKR